MGCEDCADCEQYEESEMHALYGRHGSAYFDFDLYEIDLVYVQGNELDEDVDEIDVFAGEGAALAAVVAVVPAVASVTKKIKRFSKQT